MRSKIFHIYATAIVLLLTCLSCRRDLCYDHYPAVDLSFSWEQEWERDYGMSHKAMWNTDFFNCEYDALRPGVPEWVKMIRYNTNGEISERVFSPEGSKFEVEIGVESSVLFYNGDTEYIILSDVASFNDVRATATTRTRTGSSLQMMQEIHNVSRTTNPPDVIFSAYVDYLPGAKIHEVKPLSIKMQPLVYSYLISFEFEHGFEHVLLSRGALGGMAEGVYLRSGVTTDESSIILFDCDMNNKGCRSLVRSFGIPGFPDSYFGRASGRASGPFTLNLEVMLKNGKTVNYDFDISDQIKNQPRGGIIRITGLRVEDEIAQQQPAGPFIVDVSDWGDNVEQIDLPIDPIVKK